jgi:hypothetical protein
MKPRHHAIISGGLAAGLFWWLHSWGAALACFVSGIFIDVDHHLDYFLNRKKVPLDYQELHDYCINDRAGKIYIIFHSYELMVIFGFGIYHFQLNAVWLGAVLGVTIHIICDQLANPLKPTAYFWIYRQYFGFQRKHLFTNPYA